MFFLPISFLIFILFILFLPFIFVLAYLNVITLGFEKLGISPEATSFLLFLILIGSFFNIPLTKKKLVYKLESRFFGLWQRPRIETQGVAINVGGAIFPLLISFYFLFLAFQTGISLKSIFIVTFLMIILCQFLAKIIPGLGVALPTLIPPIFSAIFSLIFVPEFAAPAAFISGVLGTLIGADLLNLKKVQKMGGFLSIGGAGVFDGIFLVGVISSLLSGF
jgi:uncharacterized membrane protein